ncbi:BTAD domain-containing putative transcriptional regulator [Streptomyces sp. NPDC088090]|uniref:BTAD domain-containing putative transcriptional regulator n=1 Tax=Streptomyces sp. NPDC088090 TaxID=3365822 RepID=UPI00384C8762
MDFALLGPFEARHEGRPVPLGIRRQERCLLALLLLEAGRAVPTARLAGLLWDGAPPPAARATLHTYVGRLRAALRPYGVTVSTRHDGYAVETDGHTVDVREFLDLLGRAAHAGDPGERLRCHDRALALWRGPLLDGTLDPERRARLGGRLAELRLTALEQRAETHLTMGLHTRVLADLAPLAAAHPDRERLVAALMTALYRDGRQAEALETYRTTRDHLAGELGIDPGPALTTLHERILAADPRLDRPPAPLYAVRVRDHWLPWTTGGHPALEFCNTYAGWHRGPGTPGSDWLRSYATLAVWAGHLDLADDTVVDALLDLARARPDEAAATLTEARAFRTALYACLTDPADGRAFRAVAATAGEAAATAVLTAGTDGLAHWRLPPSAGLRLPLLATARAAADLLTTPARLTLRACPGADCGWLFQDATGRRRWCSLSTCGAAPSPAPGAGG